MEHSGLLESQKNEIFDLLVGYGFNPSEFTINDEREAASVFYKNKDYYCLIYFSPKYFKGKLIVCPGTERKTDTYLPENPKWEDYKKFVVTWINDLKKELNTESKWKKLEKEKVFLSNTINATGDRFTESEILLIKEKINQVKLGLKSIGLEENQISKLNEKLDNLTELTKTLTKINWVEILIGTLISQILSLQIPLDKAEQVWTLVRNAFTNWLLLN